MSTLRRHGLFMKGGGVTYAYYIYGIPHNSTSVLKIDPSTDTATTFGTLAGTDKWYGGVLASVPVGSNLLSIPANLADLPGSAYNQHCNKL